GPAGAWVVALLAGLEVLEGGGGRALRRANGAVFLDGGPAAGGPLQRHAELDALEHEVRETEAAGGRAAAALDRTLAELAAAGAGAAGRAVGGRAVAPRGPRGPAGSGPRAAGALAGRGRPGRGTRHRRAGACGALRRGCRPRAPPGGEPGRRNRDPGPRCHNARRAAVGVGGGPERAPPGARRPRDRGPGGRRRRAAAGRPAHRRGGGAGGGTAGAR